MLIGWCMGAAGTDHGFRVTKRPIKIRNEDELKRYGVTGRASCEASSEVSVHANGARVASRCVGRRPLGAPADAGAAPAPNSASAVGSGDVNAQPDRGDRRRKLVPADGSARAGAARAAAPGTVPDPPVHMPGILRARRGRPERDLGHTRDGRERPSPRRRRDGYRRRRGVHLAGRVAYDGGLRPQRLLTRRAETRANRANPAPRVPIE